VLLAVGGSMDIIGSTRKVKASLKGKKGEEKGTFWQALSFCQPNRYM